MITYEGNIIEEPDIASWVLRTLRDNGPMDLPQIAGTLTFYKPEYVAAAVDSLYDQDEVALSETAPWLWMIVPKGDE